MVRFSTLNPDGSESNVKVIQHSDILACPSVILLPSHYRSDGSCRHNEPNCESDGCTNLKYDGEIFCKQHLM